VSPLIKNERLRERTGLAVVGLAALSALLLTSIARAQENAGATIFAARCSVCHGPQAAGIPGTFPSLHEQVVAFSKSEAGRDYMAMVVTSGLMGELSIGGVRYNNVMPAQSGLSEADVAAVLTFLASGLGKAEQSSPAVSASDVKEARARHPDNTAQGSRKLRPANDS
jgi:mono/diheme cytochrome c family protein